MSTQNKHILVLSSWYPSRVKPFLGNFIQRFAEIIASKYSVTVLYVTSDSSISQIETVESKKGNLREIIVYHPKQKNLFAKFFQQYKAFKIGLKLVQNVSVIQANVLYPKGFQFYLAKRYYKCPMILTEHGSYYREEIKKKRTFIEKFYFSFLTKQFSQVTAVSDLLREDMQQDFKNLKIQVLPNAIDNNFFKPLKVKPKNEKVQFLHVSTLDESVKDPKGILDACKLLVNGGFTDFHLTIVSDEPYAKWESYLYSKSITNYVTFKGPLNEEEILPFYQTADAFILFSRYETFSIVLAEAWSCGLPVITTPVGIGKNIEKALGYQVEVEKPETLARAMYRFALGKDNFDSSYIRNHSKKFSKENVLSIYKKLIGHLPIQ